MESLLEKIGGPDKISEIIQRMVSIFTKNEFY